MTFLPSSNNNSNHSRGSYYRYLTRRRRQPHLPVYFFVDVSNIWCAGQQFLVKSGHVTEERCNARRICVEFLVELARGPRQLSDGYACAGGNRSGDIFGAQEKFKAKWESVGVRFDYRENVTSATEQSVDLAIRHEMALLALKTTHAQVAPGVVVLATGDGNRNEGDSFVDRLQDLKMAGHHIELMSWSHSLHAGMEDWVWQNDGDVILLDRLWKCLTFEQRWRTA